MNTEKVPSILSWKQRLRTNCEFALVILQHPVNHDESSLNINVCLVFCWLIVQCTLRTTHKCIYSDISTYMDMNILYACIGIYIKACSINILKGKRENSYRYSRFCVSIKNIYICIYTECPTKMCRYIYAGWAYCGYSSSIKRLLFLRITSCRIDIWWDM